MRTKKKTYRSFKKIAFRFSGLFVGLIILLLWGTSMATSYKFRNQENPESGKPQVKKTEKVYSNIFKRA